LDLSQLKLHRFEHRFSIQDDVLLLLLVLAQFSVVFLAAVCDFYADLTKLMMGLTETHMWKV
jgi:hypothetical protein